MGGKMKPFGLTVKTGVQNASKVSWQLINSAPVTKAELGFELPSQHVASSSRRLEALASSDWRNTMSAMKESQAAASSSADRATPKLENEHDGGHGSTTESLPVCQVLCPPKTMGHPTWHPTVSPTSIQGSHTNGKFVEAVFNLQHLRGPDSAVTAHDAENPHSRDDMQVGEPRKLEECGWDMHKCKAQKQHETEAKPWAISEASEKGTCLVKLDTMYGLTQHGEEASGTDKSLLLSIVPITMSEMTFASSSSTAPLGKLHVARRSRSRRLSSQNGTDAYQVQRAVQENSRADSVSPDLSEGAATRYDQGRDTAMAESHNRTHSNEDICVKSPRCTSPTTAAKSTARQRFGEMMKRLKMSARSVAGDGSSPSAASCEIEETGRRHVAVDDLDASRRRRNTAPQQRESGVADVAESGQAGASRDSGYNSPSKARTLNPKATEFFSVKEKAKPVATIGDGRQARSPRRPVHGLFIPPQPAVMSPIRPVFPGGLILDVNRFAPLTIQPAFPGHDAPLGMQPVFPVPGAPVRSAMAAPMLPPPLGIHPTAAPLLPPSGLAAYTAAPHMAPMAPTRLVPALPRYPPMSTPPAHTVPRAGTLVVGKPPAPCRKPRMPDPVAQQSYEAYIEHRKLMDPEYALECKRRQAKRWERQRQDPTAWRASEHGGHQRAGPGRRSEDRKSHSDREDVAADMGDGRPSDDTEERRAEASDSIATAEPGSGAGKQKPTKNAERHARTPPAETQHAGSTA